MNRLQKKCFFAATGVHLLLLLILLVGPAFLSSHSKIDDLQTIDIIPANLIDGNFVGGGEKNPAPPPSNPQPPQPPQQQVKAETQPPVPAPKKVEQTTVTQPKIEVKTKTDPVSLEPKKTSTPAVAKPNVSTTLVTRKPTDTKTDATAAADAKRRADLAKQAARNLREGLSSTTTVDKPQGFGGGGEAYASYALVVKSVYQKSWIEPTDTASDDATAKVSVTIGSDGTVISARITQMSGDEKTDASIQRTLDRVKFIAPFPAGATDKQRTYIINFNLKAKRLSA